MTLRLSGRCLVPATAALSLLLVAGCGESAPSASSPKTSAGSSPPASQSSSASAEPAQPAPKAGETVDGAALSARMAEASRAAKYVHVETAIGDTGIKTSMDQAMISPTRTDLEMTLPGNLQVRVVDGKYYAKSPETGQWAAFSDTTQDPTLKQLAQTLAGSQRQSPADQANLFARAGVKVEGVDGSGESRQVRYVATVPAATVREETEKQYRQQGLPASTVEQLTAPLRQLTKPFTYRFTVDAKSRMTKVTTTTADEPSAASTVTFTNWGKPLNIQAPMTAGSPT